MTDVPIQDATADSTASSNGAGSSRVITAEPEPVVNAPEPSPAPLTGRRAKRRARVSRWDRPPEPHDWRWVVGHIGRALITLGLLMFGFVAYQLWGTGIETLRAQNRLESELNNRFEELGITPDTLAPPTSATVPTATTSPTTTGPPVTDATGSTIETLPPTETTTAPTETTLAPEPVPQNYGQIDPSDLLGRIIIPRIDLDFLYVAGVSVNDLKNGIGHFPNTPLPGQLGNASLAGHRTSHLAPMYDLDQLDPGDVIEIQTVLGDVYAYVVTESFVVSPNDYQVVTDSDPTVATLTLVTCTPIGQSTNRLIVKATLDVSRGSEVGEPVIYYGQDDPIPVDGELPPEETTASSTVDTAAPDETTAAAVVTAESTPVETTSATEPATNDDGREALEPASERFADDAFTKGWFDDPAAWPHVIGWAGIVAAVGYLAYRLAKRFRKLWLAPLAGFIPFIVVLYFFYENVNRLLPPAI